MLEHCVRVSSIGFVSELSVFTGGIEFELRSVFFQEPQIVGVATQVRRRARRPFHLVE